MDCVRDGGEEGFEHGQVAEMEGRGGSMVSGSWVMVKSSRTRRLLEKKIPLNSSRTMKNISSDSE